MSRRPRARAAELLRAAAVPAAVPATPAVAAPRVAVLDELASLPPSWLTDPPIADGVPKAQRVTFEPVTLALRARDGRRWYASTSAAAYAALRTAGEVALTGGELGALAVGAEQDRASPPWLAGWLQRVADGDSHRLDVVAALGGYTGAQTPNQRWPLQRVLFAWGVELVDAALGDLANPDWILAHDTTHTPNVD